MFRKRRFTKCCINSSFLLCNIHLLLTCFSFVLFSSSCQNISNNKRAEEIARSIVSDSKLIQAQYNMCLNKIDDFEIEKDSCRKEIVNIKEKRRLSLIGLSDLARLRDEGLIGNDIYNKYIKEINREFQGIRILHKKAKKEGLAFDF